VLAATHVAGHQQTVAVSWVIVELDPETRKEVKRTDTGLGAYMRPGKWANEEVLAPLQRGGVCVWRGAICRLRGVTGCASHALYLQVMGFEGALMQARVLLNTADGAIPDVTIFPPFHYDKLYLNDRVYNSANVVRWVPAPAASGVCMRGPGFHHDQVVTPGVVCVQVGEKMALRLPQQPRGADFHSHHGAAHTSATH
jgi:hypothetical protein